MTKQEFYTQHGWKGSNYNSNLTTKDIAAIVRDYVRKAHPDYRFSITNAKDFHGISVSLMEYPVELVNYDVMKAKIESEYQRWISPFYDGDTLIQKTLYTEKQIEKFVQEAIQKANYTELSPSFEDIEWINPAVLEVLEDLRAFVNSYNCEDSVVTISFYEDFHIGKNGKPAKLVARTARKVA